MKSILRLITINVIFHVALSYGGTVFMGDYCATPPFLSQSIYPNVLLILDNSGSMNEFAYKESSDCRSWNGAVQTVYTGYNVSTTYYGYFDPNSYYDYDTTNEYFYKSSSGRWSGNFLNWLTMRRIDVAKKVLIGGKIDTGTSYVLIGQTPDRDFRKIYDDTSSPYQTPFHDSLYFYFYSYSGYLYFSIRPYNGRDYTGCVDIDESSSFGTFRVALKVSSKPDGLIQRTWDRMRFGLEVFNYDNGGRIISDINGPGTNNPLINEINNVAPSTWTPLAESLYEAIRYFKGDSSAYNSGSYTSPQQYRCQKNFVIMITDGESTRDTNVPGTCFSGSVSDSNFDVQTYMDDIASIEGYSSQKCSKANYSDGTYYLEGVAYYAHTNDLLSSFGGIQNLTVYTVFCFDQSNTAKEILKMTAKYGAFVDKNNNYIPDLQSEWDEDGDGIPDAYLEAQNGYILETALKNVLTDILKKTASGTSASLLTKKTRVGKNLIQAVFYPKKQFSLNEIDWVGYLYNYWFYLNSYTSNIREDTISNKALDICSSGSIGGDLILNFLIDNSTGDLNIEAYNSDCSGTNSSINTTYMSLDNITPVWEAGEKLKNVNSTQRIIYTYTNNTRPNEAKDLEELTNLNSTFSFLFGDEDGDGIIDNESSSFGTLIYSPITYNDLKNYIYGIDISGFRNRTSDGNNVWKLGDIIYSTPKIVEYDDYSVVFVGANDGMLHAFKLGKLRYDGLAAYQSVKLCNDKGGLCNTNELGKELWSYIPKNSLPYLRALVDTKYCHLYYVDLMPFIIELDTDSDKKIDKRILIGGMRLGGGVGCSGTNCVNPPLDTCPSPATYNPATNSCIGLSSYFALDITNSTSPKFLWEFTDPELGFTYSGPALIKKDGNYYVMFASGPTNYNGESDQDLKLFVLQLNSDPSLNSFFTISSVYKIDSSVSSTLSPFNKS
ncbi:pilus assembly protein, partial [Desulfothermus sp.]